MPEVVQNVETTYGPIRGSRQHGFSQFRGIPYASPPVAALRFRPPEPPETRSGTRDVTCFGPPAAQNRDPLDHIFGRLAPGDEDCLTLNVWTPATDGARRPVMVWIHGGAFVIGSGCWPWYDGRELIRRGDLVLVTINYRLGTLGFLDLSAETGGAEYPTSGNHGLLDQVAALRWVRDNIERFGGDPENVTVFGESAGGISISCLMAVPAARGLFRRAIVMSGGPNLVRFPSTSGAAARAFLQTAGVRDVDGLRILPTKALLKAQKRFLRQNQFGGGMVFGPVVDGSVLPEPPLHAIQAGCARDVALITGTTLDEMRLWSLYVPILRWTRPHALERVLRHAVGDRWREVIAAYRCARPARRRAI